MINASVSQLQNDIDEESILKEVMTKNKPFINTIDHSNKKTFANFVS